MIDLHSHILPNLDDGSQSMEESLKMGEIALSEGFSKIIATPHYIEGEQTISKEEIFKAVMKVNDAFQKAKINLEILPGAEVYLTPNLPLLLKSGEIPTLNNSAYVLIEFPMRDIPIYTETVLYEVRLLGYKPIIAHPERYSKVIKDPNYLKKLVDQGNYVQINSLSVTGELGKKIKETAEILLKQNLVHFIGTDAHSSRTRAPKIQEAILQMSKWVSKTQLEEIINNGKNLINGKEIIVLETKSYQKQKAFLYMLKTIWNSIS